MSTPIIHLHNLPVQLTSFIGREREMAEAKQLLAGTHLLTLTGAGGAPPPRRPSSSPGSVRSRRPGEPELVHDGGPQFIGHEWSPFVRATEMTNVRTHPYHPQSNGREERVHRTFREEIPLDETASLYRARAVIAEYRNYYNERRPHSALHYLCPRDHYRGDPVKLLAERETKLRAAAERRRQYWEEQGR